ncbi:MAG: outer membrane beta-barrel family protein [Bacteroidota bacterium]
MKKYLLTCAIITGLAFNMSANDDNPPVGIGLITGIVVDASSREPMPYVNVVVKNSGDSILTGGITDDQGNFEIEAVPEGNNKVEILFIGYEKITREIDVTRAQSKHHLSTITLNESTLELEEVVVRGELSTVTQKIDRKVINVGKDLTSTGTTASELLNNVQSVSVDGQTGNITLRGNENVKILVDGRPTNVSAAQLLQQIPSSSIKSIELITNPSAKYSPEGMSGIINIVLYKNATLGLNGSINGGLTVGKNVKYNGALDLNYRKGKVNLFANYGGRTGKSEGGGEVIRTDNASYSDFSNRNDNSSHLLKVGADLYLNRSNAFSFYTTQNLYDGFRGATTLIYFEEILESENLSENLKDNHTGTYNLNFKHDFGKAGHNIEIEASHSLTDQKEDANYVQTMDPDDHTSNYIDKIHNDVTSTVINLDYTNPLSENAKLEMGLETRYSGTENQYNTDRHQFLYDDNNMMIPDGNGGFLTAPMAHSSFVYDRNIYSAYTNYSQQFGKLSMQVGVRVEQYEVEALFYQGEESENYRDDRITAYPSAFFTYTPGEKNQFQVSYSRRVDRPGIGQVNPIRSSWSSPLLVFVGNPELTPQFTNSYEINYTRRLKKGSLSLGTFYRRIDHNIIRYSNTDPLDENRVEITYVNAEGENRYGIEMSGMVRPAGWWNINGSFDLYSQQMTGYAFGNYVEVSSMAANVRMNNTFNITENLSLQLFGMYRGGNEIIQWKIKPRWMVNSGVSLKVFQKKGTLSLRINDVFNTMRFRFESTNFYPSVGGFHWESRTAYLGYAHNFGRGDFKARRRRVRDNNELSGSGGF